MQNKIHDAFDTVHAEASLKNSTKAFLSNRYRARERAPRFRRLAVALASLALVLIGFGAWNFYTVPVSAISVDVNPSMELGISRLDKVVKVESFNDEGAEILSSMNLKNLEYTDALATLFASEAVKPYVNDKDPVSVTVIAANEKKQEEMYTRISSRQYEGVPGVECFRGNREEVDEAHAAGFSFGKYRAFKELLELDPTVSTDEIQGMTMKQIRERIAVLMDGSDDDSQRGGPGKNDDDDDDRPGKHGDDNNRPGRDDDDDDDRPGRDDDDRTGRDDDDRTGSDDDDDDHPGNDDDDDDRPGSDDDDDDRPGSDDDEFDDEWDDDDDVEVPGSDDDDDVEVPGSDDDDDVEVPVSDDDDDVEVPGSDDDDDVELPGSDDDELDDEWDDDYEPDDDELDDDELDDEWDD